MKKALERVLFYYPSNKRTVSLETAMLVLRSHGYQVFFVSTCERGALHNYLEEQGIVTTAIVYEKGSKITYLCKQVLALAAYCNDRRIDYVYSHLQQANLIAVLAQYLIKAKVVIFRHHFKFIHSIYKEENLKVNRNEILADKIINKLSKKIAVPSKGVLNGMLAHESISIDKLSIIPYSYDFTRYPKVSDKAVAELKVKYTSELLIVMCARLTSFKRHIVAFKAFKKLIDEGFDIKIMVLDKGEEENRLKKFVKENSLQHHIHFLGYKDNVLDYLAAANILVHPSVTEASNSIVKESGLVGTPAIVCKGVGDFDEYIIDKEIVFQLV